MAGPEPITGLQGFVDTDPELTAQEIHGSTVNPKHGVPGETAEPYSWEAYGGAWGSGGHGPYGAENFLLGELPENDTFAAGNIAQDPTGDRTPYGTYAAPSIGGLLFNRDIGPEQLPDGNAAYLAGLPPLML